MYSDARQHRPLPPRALKAFEATHFVDDLSFRVKQLSAEHFSDRRRARVMLERYVNADVLTYKDLLAVPVTQVELLHTQLPTDLAPDWDALAAELRQRWNDAQPQSVRLYFATAKTICRVGGDMKGRLSQLDAVSHDNGVTAVFYALIATDPALRWAWVPEERIPEVYGVVHPDALLADGNGPRVIVEMCGQYSAKRLATLARFASAQHLPLQLWTIAKDLK